MISHSVYHIRLLPIWLPLPSFSSAHSLYHPFHRPPSIFFTRAISTWFLYQGFYVQQYKMIFHFGEERSITASKFPRGVECFGTLRRPTDITYNYEGRKAAAETSVSTVRRDLSSFSLFLSFFSQFFLFGNNTPITFRSPVRSPSSLVRLNFRRDLPPAARHSSTAGITG